MVKWALLNILLAFTSGIIALLAVARHKDVNLTLYEKRKVYLAKSIAIYVGIVACLVCLFSEQPMGEQMLVADKWTIVLILFLIGEILTDYFVGKNVTLKIGKRKRRSKIRRFKF